LEKKKKSAFSTPILVICWVFILMVLSGCSEQIDRLWLEAPGWSRAALVGQTSINLHVPMALNDDGTIAIFLFKKEDNTHYPHIIGLGRDAEVIWEHTIDIAIDKPTATQITWDGEELILLWIDNRSLYSTTIDISGNAVAGPTLLSAGVVADSFEIATAPDGRIILWFGGTYQSPGIYKLNLSDPISDRILVDTFGIHPTVEFDGEGTLHAAWIIYQSLGLDPLLYYAAYPEGVYKPDQQTLVSDVSIRTDSLLEGPWIGLISQQVYLFWNEMIRSGRLLNKGKGMVLHFPYGKPELADKPEMILVPLTKKLVYEDPPDSEPATALRVLTDFGDYPLTSADEFVVSPSTGDEIVLGLSLQIPDQGIYMVNQLGVLWYEDDTSGYQLLTSTPMSSLSPALQIDKPGDYYLTWLERVYGSGYSVYFTSTAHDIQETLSQLTEGDKERMVVDTIFGLLKGAVLAIIATPMWLVLPGLVLALALIFGKLDESLTHPISRAIIALGLAAFWASKLFTFMTVEDAFTFVPFLNWIPAIPANLFLPLQLGIHLIVFLIALVTAWYFAKTDRFSTPPVPLFVVFYGVVDSLLTMAVYGELLLRIL
jgi:hypothetical protein